ncbi:type II secretion system F family protein [Yersinia enterocolitica]|uniref:type II secretion system F family protein n=1 Tax=Yersinia enterocolitica TaxID=630 RepID=UPI000906E83F|nr:type II secretion system F family protein [Yersinia enterocolitica]
MKIKRILEGHSLSDSLSQFPAIFNSLYRSMIAAGELSGHLGLVLSSDFGFGIYRGYCHTVNADNP